MSEQESGIGDLESGEPEGTMDLYIRERAKLDRDRTGLRHIGDVLADSHFSHTLRECLEEPSRAEEARPRKKKK